MLPFALVIKACCSYLFWENTSVWFFKPNEHQLGHISVYAGESSFNLYTVVFTQIIQPWGYSAEWQDLAKLCIAHFCPICHCSARMSQQTTSGKWLEKFLVNHLLVIGWRAFGKQGLMPITWQEFWFVQKIWRMLWSLNSFSLCSGKILTWERQNC